MAKSVVPMRKRRISDFTNHYRASMLLCGIGVVLTLVLPFGASSRAEEAVTECAKTFATPEFQALDLLEPYGADYFQKFLDSLKGQPCTLDQIEIFFNAKHAVTINRDSKNIFFRAEQKTSGLFFKRIIGVGARVVEGRITEVNVGMEGF